MVALPILIYISGGVVALPILIYISGGVVALPILIYIRVCGSTPYIDIHQGVW